MEVLQEMKERFWLKPVAVLLGILAWLYVNIFSTTPIIREYKVKISYLNKDDSQNFKVIPEAPEVKIRVKGPRGVFIQTKVDENTFASVDLINCHGGKLTLPVNVIFPSNSNLQLVSKEPAQLVINAIKMVTKKVNVNVNMIGNVPEGYLISEPSVFPNVLSVTAPEELIDTIKECRIDLYLNDVKRSISEYRPAFILYQNGVVENDPKGKLITIENNNIKLDLAVREGYPEKQATLRPNLINRPPEGRKLDSCIITPEKVTISGSHKIIDSIEELEIEPVDLSKILKSSTLSLKVNCPKGVKLIGTSNISLSIKYTDVLITKTLSDLPLEITHDEDQVIETDISTYSLELEGYIDDINAIKSSELQNIIRVKGLTPGNHYLPIEIPYGFTERVKVKNIYPASIPVIIRLMEKVNIETPVKDEIQGNKEEQIDSSNIESSNPIASDSMPPESISVIINDSSTGSDSANIIPEQINAIENLNGSDTLSEKLPNSELH